MVSLDANDADNNPLHKGREAFMKVGHLMKNVVRYYTTERLSWLIYVLLLRAYCLYLLKDEERYALYATINNSHFIGAYAH